MKLAFIQLSSEKVADKIRVIELADLHNWTFGKDNKDLVKRIKDLKPDVIADRRRYGFGGKSGYFSGGIIVPAAG